MKRSIRIFFLFVLVALTAIAACSQATGSFGDVPSAPPTEVPSVADTAVPTPSPTNAPSPTESAIDSGMVLAPDGAGPYVIGVRLSELESRALIANVQPSFNCDESWQSAEATGPYARRLTLTFHNGRLIDMGTDSPELVTPSGARVGMPLAELHRIYGSQGTLLTGTSGNQALSVRLPDTELGIVFYLDEANASARSMRAGEVHRLEQAAIAGEGC